MRDEVLALGAEFYLDDGSVSPVFHIPGRPKNSAYAPVGVLDTLDNFLMNSIGNQNNHNRPFTSLTDE